MRALTSGWVLEMTRAAVVASKVMACLLRHANVPLHAGQMVIPRGWAGAPVMQVHAGSAGAPFPCQGTEIRARIRPLATIEDWHAMKTLVTAWALCLGLLSAAAHAADAACEAAAAEKKLAGAAKASFLKKCEADAGSSGA